MSSGILPLGYWTCGQTLRGEQRTTAGAARRARCAWSLRTCR